MYFAEFYNKNADGSLREACGDRSVLILDGREAKWSHHWHSKQWAIKHGFVAYKLCKGETFTRSSVLSGPHLVSKEG